MSTKKGVCHGKVVSVQLRNHAVILQAGKERFFGRILKAFERPDRETDDVVDAQAHLISKGGEGSIPLEMLAAFRGSILYLNGSPQEAQDGGGHRMAPPAHILLRTEIQGIVGIGIPRLRNVLVCDGVFLPDGTFVPLPKLARKAKHDMKQRRGVRGGYSLPFTFRALARRTSSRFWRAIASLGKMRRAFWN